MSDQPQAPDNDAAAAPPPVETPSGGGEPQPSPVLPPIPLSSTGPEPGATRARRAGAFAVITIVSLAIGAGATLLLTRRSTGGRPSGGGISAPSAGDDMGSMPMPSGSAVYVSAAKQQVVGVRTATVTRQALDTTIRTVGTLRYDETRLSMIHTRVSGWVEQIFVDYVGQPVKRGQVLFTVYSPDLVATQSDYLIASRARSQFPTGISPEAKAGADALLAAARLRLERWGIEDSHIKELERTGKVSRTLPLHSTSKGVVVERNTFAGQYLTPEMTAFKIADLSTIWAVGDVFEYEMDRVKIGQEIEVEFPYDSTRPLKGTITFISPEVDPQTRRVRVRAEFRNPGREFKPETFVTLVIRSATTEQLAVPREAVIDTGVRRYAILALPGGYFEPRDVEVRAPIGGFYPVTRGLSEGDRVVVSAQFLIDSETNLKAAMQSMSMSMPGMDMGKDKEKAPAQPPAPGHGAHPAAPPARMPGMDMGKDSAPAPSATGSGHPGHSP